MKTNGAAGDLVALLKAEKDALALRFVQIDRAIVALTTRPEPPATAGRPVQKKKRKPLSEESRQRYSAASKARWAKRRAEALSSTPVQPVAEDGYAQWHADAPQQ